MYKKMLVPLDGSKLAEVVFPYAKELAISLNLELILLHVSRHENSKLLPTYRTYVDHLHEVFRNQSAQIKIDMAVGHPAEEIISYAEKNQIDLILLSTHGRSGIRSWPLGGIADKVLRISKIPIWLVRAETTEEPIYDKWPTRTILVPLDGSKLAESALPHVEVLAKQYNREPSDVVLLRVCELPAVTADYPFPDWEEHLKRVTDWLRQESQRYLDEIGKRLTSAGLKVRTEILMGKPSEEIIKYATKNHFSLIVMTTHKHSGLGNWAFGYIAEWVLYGVKAPLLLVKGVEYK